MTTEEIEKLWLLVPTTCKKDRIEYCLDWLDSLGVLFNTSNGGIHVYFTLSDKQVDIWPTTCKIRIGGEGKGIHKGTGQIIKQLRKLLASEE